MAVFFFLLVAVGVSVAAVQQRQDIFSFAKEIVRLCRRIPAGNYSVQLKTYEPTPWEIICGRKKWSGKLPATNIPFGYRWVPTVNKGDRYSINTTLKNICTSPKQLGAGWTDVCQICQYIDCSKIRINGRLMVGEIRCLLGAYRAGGTGEIEVSYQGGRLGGCSAKANYKGKLMGIFVVGIR